MFCGVFLLLSLFSFQGDEITSENLNTVTIQDLFAEALNKFNTIQRSDSAPLFQKIIGILETKSRLDEDERLILTESLKYQGINAFPNETEAFFRKLIRVAPAYKIDAKDISPKIVAVFNRIRKEMVGSLRIGALDASNGRTLEGATLLIDDQPVGNILLNNNVFPLLAGRRTVEIQKTNYEPYTEEIEILADQEVIAQGTLLRNASELIFVTFPANAEVFLNDLSRGHSEETVPGGYRAQLAGDGIAIEDAGAVTIGDLPMGSYTVRFEKPCFKPKLSSLEIDAHKQWIIRPVRLEPAQAFLNVATAGDATGIVFLDRERVGILPVDNYLVCPGSYELKVRFSDGEFIKKLSFEDGETKTITAEPLPSILWFGIQSDEEEGPREDIDAMLRGLTTWNVQAVDANDSARVPINPFPVLFGGPDMSQENRNIFSGQLRGDLYMAARVVRKKVVIRHLEVAIWTPLSKRIMIKSFDFREIDKFEQLLASIDQFPAIVLPWLGIQTARLRNQPGCKIIRVHPNGPLAQLVSPAEFIQTVNGNLLRNPGELTHLRGSEPVMLTVNDREVRAVPVATIAEAAFDPKFGAPQALLAKFEKLAKYHPDPLIRKSALFNQARFQFFLGDFRQAFDIFSELTLDTAYGINQGTLYFYQGLCFRRLKLAAEARNSFQQVLAYPNATLFNAYGPKAAFWAKAELTNTNL